MGRDYAQEHRERKLITAEEREARERKREQRNAAKIAAGEIAWSTQNRKLAKLGTIGFDIPAGVAKDRFNTCPAKGECAEWCFARQGFYVWPHVAAAHERNLAIVRGDLGRFVELAVRDLTLRHRAKTVRIHDSGDFFSAAYLKAWLTIARRLPDVRFYAYTKMFAKLKDTFAIAPTNFRVIQSFGGVDDARINLGFPHARVFVSHAEREAAGYVDGTESDEPALNGAIKIGLVYHGGKNLSAAQTSALRILPDPAADLGPTPDRTAVLEVDDDGRPDVSLTLKAAVELGGDVTAPGPPRSRPRVGDDSDDRDVVDRTPPAPPRVGRAVTVYLTAKQAELLGLIVDTGAYGDTDESAAAHLLVEGILKHLPKAFAAVGFKP